MMDLINSTWKSEKYMEFQMRLRRSICPIQSVLYVGRNRRLLLHSTQSHYYPYPFWWHCALLLSGAELKPRGYYLEHVFYLDVIFINMSHVVYLDQ